MIDLPFYVITDSIQETENTTTYSGSSLLLATEEDSDISFTSSKKTQLTNLVMKTLLTTKGSVPTRPREGTNLTAYIRHGFDRDTITEDLAAVMLDAESQVKALQSLELNPTEATLDTLELSSVELITPSQLLVRFSIVPQEGRPLTLEFVV